MNEEEIIADQAHYDEWMFHAEELFLSRPSTHFTRKEIDDAMWRCIFRAVTDEDHLG